MAGGYAPPPQPMPAKPGEGSNVPGLIGFILSLVGLFLSCGSLAPIALILCIIGMRKEPKGLAIAGLVISIIGLIELFIMLMYFAAIAAFFATCAGVAGIAAQEIQKETDTRNAIRNAETDIDNYYDINGEYPDDATGNGIVEHYTDGWDNELRYERTEDGYDIQSAGADGRFDTFDDKSLEEMNMPSYGEEKLDLDDAMGTDSLDVESIPLPDDGTSVTPPELPLDGISPPPDTIDAAPSDDAPMGAAA